MTYLSEINGVYWFIVKGVKTERGGLPRGTLRIIATGISTPRVIVTSYYWSSILSELESYRL